VSAKTIFALWASIIIMLMTISATAFAEINGLPALDITSKENTLSVINGSTAALDIAVVNTGSQQLSDIKPRADLPYKWILEDISPASLTLKPNESGVLTLRLAIPASQNASTHTIKIICSNGTETSNELDIPVTISTNPQYIWWIIGGVVVVSVFTLLFFKKHGRR
jgi:uncharacterized membrane protein